VIHLALVPYLYCWKLKTKPTQAFNALINKSRLKLTHLVRTEHEISDEIRNKCLFYNAKKQSFSLSMQQLFMLFNVGGRS
jgi:CTP synthase (UTP-ammonia lyase)